MSTDRQECSLAKTSVKGLRFSSRKSNCMNSIPPLPKSLEVTLTIVPGTGAPALAVRVGSQGIQVDIVVVADATKVGLDNFDEFGAQDHGDSFAFDAEFVFVVAQKVAKVDVEHLAVVLHHYVVVVAVTDS